MTITHHNTIEGILEIAHMPDTFISEEVTTYFPENGCKIHVLIYNINALKGGIDRLAFHILATCQPVAIDFRSIISG